MFCFILVRIEEIVDDEKQNETAVSDQSKKKNKRASKNDDSSKQIVSRSSSRVPVMESEDEDGFPISSTVNDKDNISNGIKTPEGSAKKKRQVDDSEKSAKRKRDDSVVGDGVARYGINCYFCCFLFLDILHVAICL